MNDRFRFRAWDKVKYKMLDFNCFSGLYGHSFDDIVVMQCTDIKDNNDKLIYEGDVVRITFPPTANTSPTVGRIAWEDAGFVCKLPLRDYTIYNLDYLKCNTVEIIGNIYENSEPLEVK